MNAAESTDPYSVPSTSWNAASSAGFTVRSRDQLELVPGKHGEPDRSGVCVQQLDDVVAPNTAQTISDVDYGPDIPNAGRSL
jgi:hypothetical protein